MGLAQFICFFLNCMKLTELERILLWTSLLFYPLGFLYISHFPWNSHLIPTLKSKRDPYLLILSTFCLSSCQLLWKEIKSIMYKVTIRVLECLLVLRIIRKQSQISKRPLSDQEDLIIWLAAQLVDSMIIKERRIWGIGCKQELETQVHSHYLSWRVLQNDMYCNYFKLVDHLVL